MSITDIDLVVLRFVNQYFNTSLGYLAVFIIYSVYFYLIYLAYHLFKSKQNDKLFHLFVAGALGFVLVYFLKYLFALTPLGGLLLGRPGNLRPSDFDTTISTIFGKSDPAFPSSHAFIAYFCFYFLPKKFPKWLRYMLSIYLLVLIPFSLLYAGIHYPSDIIVGAVIGIAMPRIISEKTAGSILKRIFK